MRKKKSRAKEGGRWTVNLSDEQLRPRGPVEAGRRAVTALGPFPWKTIDEGDRYRRAGERYPISEEFAATEVDRLAQQFNWHAAVSKSAPRRKEIVAELSEIEELAGELARKLLQTNDITRECLHTAGSRVSGHETMLSRAAYAKRLPEVGESDPASPWVASLELLSLYVNEVRTNYLAKDNIIDVDAPDKGGPTTPYKDVYGNPGWWLVHQGWTVFEMFKPGEATGTVGGPFHKFLVDVHEYATGLGEEHSELEGWLKKTVKNEREYHQIVQRQTELNLEMVRLDGELRHHFGREARRARIAEVQREYAALELERWKLWDKIYPHAYRPKSGTKPRTKKQSAVPD